MLRPISTATRTPEAVSTSPSASVCRRSSTTFDTTPIIRLGRGRCGRRAVRVRWTQPALAAVLEWTSPVAGLFFAPAGRGRAEGGPILRLLGGGGRRIFGP